eukprot:627553-Pelagomonas_calceolata.AAC.2
MASLEHGNSSMHWPGCNRSSMPVSSSQRHHNEKQLEMTWPGCSRSLVICRQIQWQRRSDSNVRTQHLIGLREEIDGTKHASKRHNQWLAAERNGKTDKRYHPNDQ